MLDTPTPQSHPLLRWQLQRVLSPALIVLLGRLSTRTARHGLATIATCLAHGVTRPADQELRRTKLRLLRTGGVFSKDSWSYKSCLLLVIYGSRWVLPSWNYRPPIFGVTSAARHLWSVNISVQFAQRVIHTLNPLVYHQFPQRNGTFYGASLVFR